MMSLTAIFKNRKQNALNRTCRQAAFDGDFKKVLELLDQGADINTSGAAKKYGMLGSNEVSTSLGHSAVYKGNIKALMALLDKGLDVDICAGGKPLVMYALECRHEEMAMALLDRGARADHVRADLETPLSVAQRHNMHLAIASIQAQQNPALAAQPAPESLPAAGSVTPMKPLTLIKNTPVS